jgi:hypothetical protein
MGWSFALHAEYSEGFDSLVLHHSKKRIIMKKRESYWTYKSPPIPEIKDLPEKTFMGTEQEWESLSPGMRRTIYNEAMKRLKKASVV